MPMLALAEEPVFFHWWAVSRAFTHPRWRHLWNGILSALPPIGRGNDWIDASLHRNSAALEGFTFPAAWVDGIRSWALDFDGADDRGRIAHHRSLDLTDAITVEMWIRPHETNGPVLAAKRDAGNYAWQMDISADANNKLQFSVNAVGNIATSAASVPENAWTHAAATYDRKNIRVFINGKEDGSAVYAAAITTNTVDLTLGSNLTGAPAWYNGLLATARIWDRKLTPLEIRELYDSPYGMYQYYLRMEYVVNHLGLLAYQFEPGMTPQMDGGAVSKNPPTGMDHGVAQIAYPVEPGMMEQLDGGPVTKSQPTAMEHGSINVRGLHKRVDKKRKKYWG